MSSTTEYQSLNNFSRKMTTLEPTSCPTERLLRMYGYPTPRLIYEIKYEKEEIFLCSSCTKQLLAGYFTPPKHSTTIPRSGLMLQTPCGINLNCVSRTRLATQQQTPPIKTDHLHRFCPRRSQLQPRTPSSDLLS